MSDLGNISLLAALVIAIYAVGVALLGALRRQSELVHSARNATYVLAALTTLATLALLYAFLSHDFSIRYVFNQSSLEMPPGLVVAALWGGHEGSLLFWSWTLAIFTAIVAFQNRDQHRQLMPYVMATLMAIQVFFAFILVFVTSPFVTFPVAPPNGLGLNPLLYDPGMMIHPPLLLAGYMSWSVPFAFAVAALATGRLGIEWIQATRRYALVAWAILGMGNLIGAWWAYRVLGWGGYWGWDPVENVAILPWFVGTAYLHSVMIQERRGMLKMWNLALVLATFALCIFGTFVVRSGVITSVHSFAQTTVAPYYLGFLAAVILLPAGLLFWRMSRLRAENEMESMLSREASFLLQNLLFLALVFAIFWGTVFPLISELAQGVRLTVGAPYFNQVAGPILLALIALMGVGPLMPWRRASPEHLLSTFVGPVGVAAAGALVLAVIGVRQPYALVALFCCLLVLATVGSEFYRGILARRSATGEGYLQALGSLVRRNNRRYGGYVVHVGIVTMAIAIVASSFYQTERQMMLEPGETATVGGYQLTYHAMREYREPGRQVIDARVDVARDGGLLEVMHPSRRYYDNFESQPQSGIAVRSTPLEDVYVVLVGWDGEGRASLLVYVNPMVMWLWIGGVFLLIGTFICMWPEPRPRLAPAPQQLKGMALSEA